MNKITSLLLCAVFTLCLTAANLTAAPTQKTVDLGNAAHFAVLSYAGVTNAGDSVITGDLGTSPSTSVTGFPPGKVIGTIFTPTEVCTYGVCKSMKNDVAALGESSLLVAYLDAEGRTLDPVDVTGENLAGKTLTPGLYKSTSTLEIAGGDLTLSGNGVYIFQVTSGLTVSTAKVILKDGATAENVFLFRLSWKWRKRSSVKIAERTYEKRAQALHC